jgi:hypothetical protein
MVASTDYVDVEDLLIGYLSDIPGIGDIGVEMPNLPSTPFVLVTRVSGGDDYLTDHATVDIEVFHASRTTSSDFARLIHTKMLHLRRTVVSGRGVDAVDVEQGPHWLNWGDENLQRHLMSYVIHSRRHLS